MQLAEDTVLFRSHDEMSCILRVLSTVITEFYFLVFLGWNHGLGSLVSVLLLVIETLCVPVDAGCDLDGKLWVRDSLYIMSL